jgi:hypothetical protein
LLPLLLLPPPPLNRICKEVVLKFPNSTA